MSKINVDVIRIPTKNVQIIGFENFLTNFLKIRPKPPYKINAFVYRLNIYNVYIKHLMLEHIYFKWRCD